MRVGPLRGALTVAALALTGGTTTAALAATTATSNGSTSGTPTKAQKARAATAAKAALIRRSDLHGWSSVAPPKKVPQLKCGAFDPNVTGVEPLASAASRTFNRSSAGPFASEDVYAFASAAQQRTFWRRVVVRRMLDCVAASLVASSNSTVTFKVNRKHLQSVPKLGDRDREYRVIGTASLQYGTDRVYLDDLFVARGSEIAVFSFTNLYTPVRWSVESKLAHAIAARMPSS